MKSIHFDIYQLKEADDPQNDKLRHLCCAPFFRLEALEEKPDIHNYNKYNAVLIISEDETKTILEAIYKFYSRNPIPESGRYIFTSDVIVLHQNGESNAYYVDAIGFKKLPDFLHL